MISASYIADQWSSHGPVRRKLRQQQPRLHADRALILGSNVIADEDYRFKLLDVITIAVGLIGAWDIVHMNQNPEWYEALFVGVLMFAGGYYIASMVSRLFTKSMPGLLARAAQWMRNRENRSH
ncbi:MAG: hypothetical protein ACK5N7_03780 [Curvibacter sp.]